MVEEAFSPRTWEAESWVDLRQVQGQPGLQGEIQDSQGSLSQKN